MEETYFNKIITTIILAGLVILTFLLIKPILMSIISGAILAFVFFPVYKFIEKKTNHKNISALIICLALVLLILLPIFFVTPIILKQSIRVFQFSQEISFADSLQELFPSLFSSDEFAREIGSIINSFVTKTTNSLMNSVSDLVLNFPVLMFQIFVVFFTLFFALRDQEKFILYLKSLSPFSKEIEKKLFESSKGITYSVLYGQVLVGIIQGLIIGIGFYLFNIPNASLLTLLAIIAGIFPIIGTAVVWAPVLVYLLVTGDSLPSLIGIAVFGLASSWIDSLVRPLIVSKRTQIHPALVLVGMIGGFFFLGILGFILGPLILSYLFILLEVYRNKKLGGILIETSK